MEKLFEKTNDLIILFLVLIFIFLGYIIYSLDPEYNPLTKNETKSLYEKAIIDAAVVEKSEEHKLIPIKQDKVKIAVWVKESDVNKYYQEDFDKQELTSLKKKGGLFITVVPEVKEKCTKYPSKNLTLRLKQLLGLPHNDKKTHFVEMLVDKNDLFRPCADPRIDTEICTESFPNDVNKTHKAWLAQQMLNSYQLSEKGYPFTRLGYTYDWNPNTPEFGVSEYIAREGANAEILSITPTEDYCQP